MPEPELYERAKTAVADVGSDSNTHVIEFRRWVVRDTDELPARSRPDDSTVHPEGSGAFF